MNSRRMAMSSVLKKIPFAFSILIFLLGFSIGFVEEAGARSVILISEEDLSDEGEPVPIYDICDFPIYLNSRGHIRVTVHINIAKDGFVAGKLISVMHTDFYNTYEANGKTLASEKASYMINVFFSDGEYRDFHTVGQGGRILLPDGTVLSSAGLTSLKFWPEQGVGCFLPVTPCPDFSNFFLVPGVGNAGEVTAFCDALGE